MQNPNPSRQSRHLAAVPTRSDSLTIAKSLAAALQAEINAIEDPAPIGWWLIYRGDKAYNVWEDGIDSKGRPRQRTRRNRQPGLWAKREADRELKRVLQEKLNTVDQLISQW